MAGERRQNAQRPQTPERVQQAAQAMNYSASSGLQRGYIPQNTGGYRPSGYAGGQQPGYYGRPPSGQNTGGMPNVSSVSGGTRGFVMPGNTGNIPMAAVTGKKKSNAAKTTVIVLSLIAVIVAAAFIIKALIEQNKTNEENRIEQKRIASMQNELGKYDSLYFPGIYVDGIHLGGMTPEQAKNSVQSQIQQRSDAWYVTLTYQGKEVVTIKADMLGMSVNPDEVLNRAWAPGHYGTLEERYATMLQLQQEPYTDYTAQPSGDTSVIDSYLAEIKRRLDRPAVDASVSEFEADMNEPFIFQNEVYGISLNTDQLKTRLYHMVSSMESGTVEINPDTIEPKVKKADLEKYYQIRVSVYTPIDRHSSDNRNDNIRQCFSKINGYVLNPGKTFSFNKIVGKRTIMNGFKTATEYVYGEHVEGVGGGACQASTTVYHAAVMAGLDIKERHAHSDYVSYTDYGKDATVSDTKGHEKDLKFVNTTDYPIYFKAEVVEDPSNKTRLIAKVTLYGYDMGNVRYELFSELTEVLDPPVEPQYIKDKNAEYVTYNDEEKVVSKAKEGYVYKAYRLKFVDNQEVERKLLNTDTYKAQPEKIYVGITPRE